MDNPVFSPEAYEVWARSDEYHNSFLIEPDAVLEAVAKSAKEKGIAYEFSVSPAHGKFLNLLLLSLGAKRVLEVGSLAGYSAIWMARALPDDGEVVSLELDPFLVKAIEENVENAGLSSKVKVIAGPALSSMQTMQPETPFDFIFIDADKANNTNYFIEAKRLMVDNVGQSGGPGEPHVTHPYIEGVRELLRYIKDDIEVEATTIHTVGEKGFDGFLYAYRK
ncbi:hypothetical protein MVEN_01153500 [Mycena venus]|uniref:O-methyltransferase n=1 Tax=Mycena venus TaxID=2733690 RepID=A0A8H6Y3D0_9AGAR|nr:hypothetical protein MVEN_01153500 [Mycena venus]